MTSSTGGLMAAERLACRRGGRTVLRDVTLAVAPGELVGVLGANGAGKSTLLSALAGELAPADGEVRFDGRPIGAWTVAMLAARRAVLPQSPSLGFDLAVRGVLDMGFYPHAARDFDGAAIIVRAAALADVADLLDRRYRALSGGEQQRVQFARVLAQLLAARPAGEARALLLDEPTSSLDPRHQMGLLDAVRGVTRSDGVAALAILHDVNLAAAWCDRLLLLADGGTVAIGPPAEVLTPAVLEAVYRVRARVVPYPGEPERPLVLFR